MSEYTNLNPSGNTGFDIARLNIAEATPVNLFGYNPVVGTTYETLWNVGGKYPINATEGTLSVVSSAAGDSSKRVLMPGISPSLEAHRRSAISASAKASLRLASTQCQKAIRYISSELT